MFDRVGEIVYPASAGSADAVMEAAIEAGAEDAQSDGESHVVTCAADDLGAVSAALEAALGEADTAKLVWRPQTMTEVGEDDARGLMKLIDALEDDDDVQNVVFNADVSADTLQKLAG